MGVHLGVHKLDGGYDLSSSGIQSWVAPRERPKQWLGGGNGY